MEKRNYQREMEAEIARLEGRRPSLLLHSCCGPCSSAVLERLCGHFRVTLLYYNPNIEPEEEYLHRLSEQKRLLTLLPEEIPLLECGYEHEAFEAFAPAMADAPEGGERCLACFAMRREIPFRRFQKEKRIPAFPGTVETVRAVPAGLLRMQVLDESSVKTGKPFKGEQKTSWTL